ncbi:MAG: hypothetical protein M0C28_01265 [Candidatus Moduliflexus flocculans]|nr:hypothetical protein [Candidatus Moduliflexus flocculans]
MAGSLGYSSKPAAPTGPRARSEAQAAARRRRTASSPRPPPAASAS